ncbi:MAG TPA: hypothetical protein VFQ61_32635, partial [Polyangiaceae bacterium]|nr:hypothetical protein [Polyangiaceae bacterium]
KTLLRTFDEGSLPPRARARLVAIAAAELVLASWAELTYQPSLRVQPLGPVASEKDVHAVLARLEAGTGVRVADAETPLPAAPMSRPWYAPLPREERMFHLSALGSVRAFLQHPGQLWGAGVRVSEEALRATSWSVDALYEGGTLTGKQDLRYRIQTWSFAASLLLYYRTGIVTARAGAGLRVGAVKAESLDRDLGRAKNVLVPWGWPLLVLSLSARSGPVVLNVSAEGSYAAIPVAGGTITPISGIWVGTQWGIGFIP